MLPSGARVPATLLPRAAAAATSSAARGFQAKAAGGAGGRRGRREDIKGGRGAGLSRGSEVAAAFCSGGALGSGISRAGRRRGIMAQAEEARAPLLQDEEAGGEWSSRPRRIALFVEPSPFSSVHVLRFSSAQLLV